MFVLHVDLQVKPDAEQELQRTYVEIFRPAISRQEGLSAVALLRPADNDTNYRLSILFDTQTCQQKWVATDVHQQVWPQMERCCVKYSVRYYDTV